MHKAVRFGASATARDEGFGLVEAIVALFLLALIIVPVTHVLITTTSVSNDMHLRLEAADLASQQLATISYDAEQGQQWNQGETSTTQFAGGDQFVVSLDVEPVNASQLCVSGGVAQAWTARATVSWGGGGGASNVAAGHFLTQSTIIPAPQSTGSNSPYGEIAIPVYQSSGALETSVPISISLTGTCQGSSCPAQPYPSGPPFATETVSTGTAGCAVFTDLYAGSGWTYSATVTDADGDVDASEHSSAPGASAPVLSDTLSTTAGSVSTPAGGAGFDLAPGAEVQIGFQMTGFTVNGTVEKPPQASAAVLPITVDSNLPGLSCPTLGCTLGDGVSTFNGSDSALLYPVALSSGETGDNYLGWAGGAWADPSASLYCPASPASCSVGPTAFASAAGSVEFPVYPLAIAVSDLSSGEQSVALSATPVGTSSALSLNPAVVSGSATTAQSTTGLPLGEYELSATPALSTPSYIWITPSGICTWTSATAPAAPCSNPSTSPVSVVQ